MISQQFDVVADSCNCNSCSSTANLKKHPEDNKTLLLDFTRQLNEGSEIQSATVLDVVDLRTNQTNPALFTATASTYLDDDGVVSGVKIYVTGGIPGHIYRVKVQTLFDDTPQTVVISMLMIKVTAC